MERPVFTRRRLLGGLGVGMAGMAVSTAGASPVYTLQPTHKPGNGDGQGGAWPAPFADVWNTSVGGTGPSGPIGTNWSHEAGEVARTPPVVSSGLAYIATDSGVTAVDRTTGDEQWSVTAGGPNDLLYLDGSTLYIPGGTLTALDANTGEEFWTANLSDRSYGLVTSQEFAFVAGLGGVIAVDRDRGESVWQNDEVSVSSQTLVMVGDALYAVDTSTGRTLSIDSGDGNRRWRNLIGTTVTGSLGTDGNRLYVPGDDALYALDLVNGTIQWRYEQSIIGSPVVAASTGEGEIIVNLDGGETASVSIANGEEQWRASTISSTNAPALAGGQVYVVGDDGTVLGVSATDGSVAWQSSVGASVAAGPAVAGGELLLATADGSLHALNTDAAETATQTATDQPANQETETTPIPSTTAADEEEEPEEDDEETEAGGPGFDLIATLGAIAAMLIAVLRRGEAQS